MSGTTDPSNDLAGGRQGYLRRLLFQAAAHLTLVSRRRLLVVTIVHRQELGCPSFTSDLGDTRKGLQRGAPFGHGLGSCLVARAELGIGSGAVVNVRGASTQADACGSEFVVEVG